MAGKHQSQAKRWCMICGVLLLTCKTYIRIDSTKSIRTGIQEALSDLVGENVSHNPSNFLCQKCETKTNKVTKLSTLTKEIREEYAATKLKYVGTRGGTPEKMKERGQKRLAVGSPGTPMSKARPKRLIHLQDDREIRSPPISPAMSSRIPRLSPRCHVQLARPKRLIHLQDDREIRSPPISPAMSSRIPRLSPRCHVQLRDTSSQSVSVRHPDQVKAKARLSFESHESSPTHKITIHHGGVIQQRDVPEAWTCVAQAICERDEKAAVDHVLKMEYAQQQMRNLMVTEIRQETRNLCKPGEHSLFLDNTVDALREFSIDKQMEELKEKAPLFVSMLQSAAEGERITRNVLKTKEKIIPQVVTAASVILHCKSQRMNSHQSVNSLMLKNCGVKKTGLSRLKAKGLALSYTKTLEMQTEFGKDYDKTVKEWAEEVRKGNATERQLMEEGDKDGVERFNRTRTDVGYQLVMDNVDLMIHARHPTKTNYGQDYHMAHVIAIQNRVNAYHKSSEHELPELAAIEPDIFLPNASDNRKLQHEWGMLCGRIVSDHMPGLKAELQGLPRCIPHEHMHEAKKKSTVINLGVIMENENTSEGIYKIMHYMHSYVPGDNTEQPTTIVSAGDLLTCERESSCIEEQRNSSTPSKRLEGLMPVIADFHALANFYQIVWKHLYDPASGADKGTLFAARNYLQARDVTLDPMKNVNAAEHLLAQYTTALIIAAALYFFGMDDCESEPTRNKFRLDLHGDRQNYSNTVMHEFVEQLILPSNEETSFKSSGFVCTVCSKKYASKKNLVKHQRDKGHGRVEQPQSKSDSDDTDSIQNYSRVALGMGLLAMNFRDARQHGDGERIIRLYKFMLLHCKAAKKPKYSFHILRLLAQVKVFLSPRLAYELVWNRFVNTTGKEDGNAEVDRVMEHHNRTFKDGSHGLRGKITQKNVDRISRSAQQIEELVHRVDQEYAATPRASSKHKVSGKDAVTLALELHKCKIFEFHPGRAHHRFPQFPSSVFSAINAAEIYDWIRSTIRKLYRQNQFQSR